MSNIQFHFEGCEFHVMEPVKNQIRGEREGGGGEWIVEVATDSSTGQSSKSEYSAGRTKMGVKEGYVPGGCNIGR